MRKDELDFFKLVSAAPIFRKKHPARSTITQTMGDNDGCRVPLQSRDYY
jgi:hypothetical protein